MSHVVGVDVVTVDNPEIVPLGPGDAVEPRPIDAGLLDSRE